MQHTKCLQMFLSTWSYSSLRKAVTFRAFRIQLEYPQPSHTFPTFYILYTNFTFTGLFWENFLRTVFPSLFDINKTNFPKILRWHSKLLCGILLDSFCFGQRQTFTCYIHIALVWTKDNEKKWYEYESKHRQWWQIYTKCTWHSGLQVMCISHEP